MLECYSIDDINNINNTSTVRHTSVATNPMESHHGSMGAFKVKRMRKEYLGVKLVYRFFSGSTYCIFGVTWSVLERPGATNWNRCRTKDVSSSFQRFLSIFPLNFPLSSTWGDSTKFYGSSKSISPLIISPHDEYGIFLQNVKLCWVVLTHAVLHFVKKTFFWNTS